MTPNSTDLGGHQDSHEVQPGGLQCGAVFSIVQSVRPGPRTGLRKIHAVRPISGLDGARPEHP